jgi:hypothetical protein
MNDDAWIVARGVDTLVLNAFYLDEIGKKNKRELGGKLRELLEAWKKEAVGMHTEIATGLTFEDKVLHMQPNGAGRGQWPWMLKTPDMTLYISGGHWNGIASIRLSSQYLWSSPGLPVVLKAVQSFVDDLFEQEMYLQLSQVDVCVDVAGWSDIEQLDRWRHFVTRSIKGGGYDEPDMLYGAASREYTMGLKRTGFDFARSGKRVGSLSCRMYDKTRELKKSGKDWFYDLYRSRGWDEYDDGPVWRVEFSFKREALHELLQEVDGVEQFHGIEDAHELPDRLPLLWAYATGQVEGGSDGAPDGWLRCVVPHPSDKKRSRWPTHPVWKVVQGAFLEDIEMPPQFGKIVRKRWEDHNIEKGVEAMIGYASSLAAWAAREFPEFADPDMDFSVFLHWFAEKGTDYLKRLERDFGIEVQRKRVRFGVSGEETSI